MTQKKILLVENDDFYIDVVGKVVQELLKHELLVAKSAASEALPLVIEGQPDLVLLDLDADSVSAIEFAERMRDEAGSKRIPVLGFSNKETKRDEALGRGCVAFLAKPLKVRELEAMIGRLLQEA